MFNRTRKSNFKIFVACFLLFALVLSVCSCTSSTKGTLKQYASDIVTAVINKDINAMSEVLKAHYADYEMELMYMELAYALDGVSSFKLKDTSFEIVALDGTELYIMTANHKTNIGDLDIEAHTYTNSTGLSYILITPAE